MRPVSGKDRHQTGLGGLFMLWVVDQLVTHSPLPVVVAPQNCEAEC